MNAGIDVSYFVANLKVRAMSAYKAKLEGDLKYSSEVVAASDRIKHRSVEVTLQGRIIVLLQDGLQRIIATYEWAAGTLHQISNPDPSEIASSDSDEVAAHNYRLLQAAALIEACKAE